MGSIGSPSVTDPVSAWLGCPRQVREGAKGVAFSRAFGSWIVWVLSVWFHVVRLSFFRSCSPMERGGGAAKQEAPANVQVDNIHTVRDKILP